MKLINWLHQIIKLNSFQQFLIHVDSWLTTSAPNRNWPRRANVDCKVDISMAVDHWAECRHLERKLIRARKLRGVRRVLIYTRLGNFLIKGPWCGWCSENLAGSLLLLDCNFLVLTKSFHRSMSSEFLNYLLWNISLKKLGGSGGPQDWFVKWPSMPASEHIVFTISFKVCLPLGCREYQHLLSANTCRGRQ